MYGGVETFLTTLVRESHAAPGMRTEFAACFAGRLTAELETLGRPAHSLPAARLSRPLTVLRARRALGDLLSRSSFDVVVCHQPWACVLFASVIRARGLPVVLWVHMATDGRHWLERLCRASRPDLAVCNSRFTADCASSWLPRRAIEYAYCPLSLSRFQQSAQKRPSLRRSLQTPHDDVVLVHASRLESFKGQHLLLEALATLRDLPGWTCWIVGGAQRAVELDYLRRLEVSARTHGIAERVRFTGERDDVHDVLSAADVYCQPNTSPEGFGLTFIEAMGAGLPVVTSGIGGACEIVSGSCGALTQPGDIASLSGALRRLVVDSDLRARLGGEARKRPHELCDPVLQMRRIQALLTSVMISPPLEAVPAVNAK
jgi:glycosyltransferase involved in cell wall biosynthesis